MNVAGVEDGIYYILSPVVFHCGCGNVTPKAKSLLAMAGTSHVPLLNTNMNKYAKKYIQQEGLRHKIPSLNKSSHAVLYNPHTQQYIDLKSAPRNTTTFSNIFKVASA